MVVETSNVKMRILHQQLGEDLQFSSKGGLLGWDSLQGGESVSIQASAH